MLVDNVGVEINALLDMISFFILLEDILRYLEALVLRFMPINCDEFCFVAIYT